MIGSRPIRATRKLARLYAGGLLEAIAVPSEQIEALRDLVRAREDARLDRMRDRHRMSKFLLRHGLRMPNKSWGATRRSWLGSLTFAHVHQQQAFQTYLHTLDLIDRRVEALERQLDEAAKDGRWAALVARLRCLRGVDTLTALVEAAWHQRQLPSAFRCSAHEPTHPAEPAPLTSYSMSDRQRVERAMQHQHLAGEPVLTGLARGHVHGDVLERRQHHDAEVWEADAFGAGRGLFAGEGRTGARPHAPAARRR